MTNKLTITLATVATGAALLVGAPAADAVEIPERAVITCQSATMYRNYDHALGAPVEYVRTLYTGDGVGHTSGKHPVYNGWASIQDFGPNDWGFVRIECLGR